MGIKPLPDIGTASAFANDMTKVLSIRQPWAWLIATGIKDIENRTWETNFRGTFLIHAGKTFDYEGYEWVISEMGVALRARSQFEVGGIVGEAEIIDCVTSSNSPWFSGPYGFVLRNARPRRFTPLSGKLGFFDVDDVEAKVATNP